MGSRQPTTIALNLLYIESGYLTGPGYYAVQIMEHLAELLPATGQRCLCAYVRRSARHHFSDRVQSYLRDVPLKGGRIKRVLTEQIILPFIAKKDNISLLFSPTFVSPLWGAKHLVVTIVDMYYRVTPDFLDSFQRRYWAIMIPLSARACDAIITISDSVADDVKTYLPWAYFKTTAIPLASRFRPTFQPDDLVKENFQEEDHGDFLLMVANVTRNKNPEVVIRAISHLRSKGRKVRLVHVGKDHLGLLATSVDVHDARDMTASFGKVSDERLIELYRSCLAAVVPSFYEGFGMPAVEAQSQGAPLLSSNRGSLPEVGGDAALYFDPDDYQALAEHIELLLDHPDFRKDLIKKGYLSASRFSWSMTAERTLKLFDSIMAPMK